MLFVFSSYAIVHLGELVWSFHVRFESWIKKSVEVNFSLQEDAKVMMTCTLNPSHQVQQARLQYQLAVTSMLCNKTTSIKKIKSYTHSFVPICFLFLFQNSQGNMFKMSREMDIYMQVNISASSTNVLVADPHFLTRILN